MGSAIFAKLIRRDAVRAAMSAAVGAEVREAAKGDPSLHERCARCLITHYLTRPGPSSACYDGWIRVTSGMIRRKYSGYRESHRESRQDVICAGFHGNEAVASLFVGGGAGDPGVGGADTS